MNFKKKLIIVFLFSFLSILFVYNDHFLYKRSILKIDSIKEKTDDNETTKEKHITQTIFGTIKNGKYKGKKVKVMNHTSTSGVYDEQIHKHSEIFVEVKSNDTAIGINGVKRDKYIAILLIIFIDSIVLVAGRKGIKTLVSLFINILISFLAIYLFQKHARTWNMLLLYLIISIIFVTSSLLITNKKSRKTLAAIISSIASFAISFSLAFLIIKLYKKPIPYWTLEYIEAVHDYENFFYVTILLSGLGAIMDIAITISSSLHELIIKDPSIKLHNLVKSGKEICKDIIGTMNNVMLFTCFTSIIPMTFLLMKNNIVLGDAIKMYSQVELIVVLTSCISIVLAIPISLYISTIILHPSKRRNNK